MASHNLQNGVLPNQQFHPQHVDQLKNPMTSTPANDVRFNGVHSAHSSRSASPSTSATRLQQIPSAQLPPSVKNIPATQLPPTSRSPINAMAQNMGQLTLNTPTSGVSSRFSTSTPNQGDTGFPNSSSGVFSPISSQSVPKTGLNGQNPFGNHNQPMEDKLNSKNVIENNRDGLNNAPGGQNNNNFTGQTLKSPNSDFQSNTPLKQQFPNTTTPNFQQFQTQPAKSNESNPNNISSVNTQPNSSIQPQNPFKTTFSQANALNLNQNISPLSQSQALNRSNGPFNLNFQNSATSSAQLIKNPPTISSLPPQSNQNIFSNQQNPSLKGSESNSTVQPINFNQFAKNSNNAPTPSHFQPSVPVSTSSNQSAQPANQFPVAASQNQFKPIGNSAGVVQSVPNPVPASQFPATSQSMFKPVTLSSNSGIPGQFVPKPVQSMPNQVQSVGNTLQNSAATVTNSVQANQFPAAAAQSQFKPALHNNRYPMQSKSQQMYPNVGNQNYQSPQQNQQFQQHQQNQFQQQNMQFQPNQQFQQQNQQFQQQPPQFGPQKPQQNQFGNAYQNQHVYGNSVTQSGFNKLWGTDNYDLLQSPNILPPRKEPAPRIHLGQQQLDEANCSPDIFRCTMTRIPESNALLQKSRLPLGILIHPFKDLNHLPVIQCNVIVRCRACRTYINPFVYFVDSKRWKCNLCYRINELPEEFQFDPISKTYGDPSRRPEIKSSTIEYIAPAEYMLRPPQPAVYLFLLDVSRLAVESGYLNTICSILTEELDNLPGDSRTQIGFIAFDSHLHFFSLAEGLSKPHEMTVLDIEDVFLPTPDNLLVNLKDHKELVVDLLSQLPTKYSFTYDTNSALGAALQAAFKMMSATGGRVTVFQAALPNVGPGGLIAREDPGQRASTQEVQHLNPANDFYKRLALECSGQQIAVDLFAVNSQYIDMATISGISRFSGGSVQHFPLFKASRPIQNESLSRCFRRYLVRKIGFEAVMRIRCTRGLSIHTFHGNFFVRSTDLLSLPNVNPDAGFGMQVSIDESLSDVKSVCFQAALLYTSSKGERRIRVHTLCLPICATLHDVINSADQECIVGLLAKMAVDRSMQSSLSDAREAFINVAIDILSSYKLSLNMSSGTSGLMAPECLRLLPLFISALLKSTAFRTGTSTRLDDRVQAMIDMKTKPLVQLMQQVYPDLYPVHDLENQQVVLNSEEETIPLPPRLQLTARCLDNKGAFLLDSGDTMILLVCPNISQTFLTQVLGVPNYNAISDVYSDLPILDNPHSMRLHMFLNYLNEEKPFAATLHIIKDNSPNRAMFFERLIEDRVENALSYHEFLQHIKTQIK